MITDKQLTDCRKRLHSRIPLVGARQRRSALEMLVHNRNDPRVVPLLTEAVFMDYSLLGESLSLAAQDALADLEAPEAVDCFCALWERSRHGRREERLTDILLRAGYVARGPASVRVLTAFKTNSLDALAGDGKDTVRELVELLTLRDGEISPKAESVLGSLTSPEAVDAFCEEWSWRARQPWGADPAWGIRYLRERLTDILVRAKYVARGPSRAQVRAALKTNSLDALAGAGPGTVRVLIEELADEDKEISANAETALGSLTSPEAVDAFCKEWSWRADHVGKRLTDILVRARYVAQGPASVRVRSALKTNSLDALAGGDANTVRALVEALVSLDSEISSRAEKALGGLSSLEAMDALCALWAEWTAEVPYDPHQSLHEKFAQEKREKEGAKVIPVLKRVLRALPPGASLDALCQAAIRKPNGATAHLCVEADHRPSDHMQACLFLCVTGQVDAYFQEDQGFQGLLAAYEAADLAVQKRVIEAVSSGDPRWTDFYRTVAVTCPKCEAGNGKQEEGCWRCGWQLQRPYTEADRRRDQEQQLLKELQQLEAERIRQESVIDEVDWSWCSTSCESEMCD